MNTGCRWWLAVACLFSLSLFAQEKGDEKKADAKNKLEKKDDKKSVVPANKYQSVGKIAGKLSKTDTDEMLIEIEVRVQTGRNSGHNEKVTYTIANDVKVRRLKLPERPDGSNKPYTQEQKIKAKGDNTKLPGYTSKLDDLKSGQIIELELSLNKPAAGAAKNDEKPFVTMIVIGEEPPKVIEKKKK